MQWRVCINCICWKRAVVLILAKRYGSKPATGFEPVVVPVETWYAFWLDKSGSDAPTSKVYAIIHDWKNQWAQWNCCEPTECEEAPLPGGDLFRILAQDIYTFAKQPYLGYRQF